MEKHQLLINGDWKPARSGETFSVINPAVTKPIAQVAKGTPEDVDEAARAARKAFDEGPWPWMRASERAKILFKLANLIRENLETIARIESLNVGKPIRD
ncbi:aldehyde dehydrogenase family protein [Candidatus Sumerlaeota bacterium]|nr:aldehyde dehydrogenase family protein [Candidatus Sumerlaeota bacterium]